MRIKTEHGEIAISNTAIAAVAAGAARACFGVKGTDTGPLAHFLRRDTRPGVCARALEDGSLALTLHIGVGYGVNIPAVCRSIISEMRYQVERQTGVSVGSVNIYVDALRP